MKKSYISTTVFVFVCILAFATIGLSQADNKCVGTETECAKSDQKTSDAPAKAEASKLTQPANALAPGSIKTTSSTGRGTDTRSAAGAQQETPVDNAQDLAKKLSNPIASLTSVPFQNNFDYGMGPNKDGFRYTMNFQPVIPVPLGKDWNLISRTIVPVISQHNVVGTSSQFGLGDIVQSFFFSPNKSGPIVWGAGPVAMLPTGTNKYLGSQKLGFGPTVVALTQQKQLTIGMLFNHIWSVAGKDSRANVSATFLQPFVAYTTKKAWTFTFNAESTYDWTGKSWSVPIHFQVTKLVKVGKQPISVGGALRCWATSGTDGPHWCGFRLIFTPLFPKK